MRLEWGTLLFTVTGPWLHERGRSRLHLDAARLGLDCLFYLAPWARAPAPHSRGYMLLEEVPGFAVGFPAGAFAGDAGIEAEAGGAGYGFYWGHVTGIERNDVGNEDSDV